MKDLLLFDDRIFEMIRDEGDRQKMKWGVQRRTPFEWMTYLTEEVGELAAAISEFHYDREELVSTVIKEAIQVATLAAKIAEMHLNLDAALDE